MKLEDLNVNFIHGDCLSVLKTMKQESVHCCVTSPPYWGLRDYGVEDQLGLEKTPEEYVSKLVDVFREVKRVLRDDGTLWLNLGDSYAQGGGVGCSKSSTLTGGGGKYRTGSKLEAMDQINAKSKARKAPKGFKPKDLVGIPWRVAFALQADGWYLRQDIIWHKPNPMPESVRDRCTKSHEYIFLLSKKPKYYFDFKAIQEPAKYPDGPGNKKPHSKTNANGSIELRTRANLSTIGGRLTRNRRSVWTVTTKPFRGAHFATFPIDLIEPCILAGCPEKGIVLDPFSGAGTTSLVSNKLNRDSIGIELNQEYIEIAQKRIQEQTSGKIK